MWEAFAAATAALPGGTESEVAEAGLRGALDVFGARRVEIEVRAATGERRYAQDGPGQDNAVAGLPGPAITRSMAVSGETVGELTVWLSEPTLPVPRDEAAISAYGDALGGALHDAAARARVAALEEKVAYDNVRDQLTGLLSRTRHLPHHLLQLERLASTGHAHQQRMPIHRKQRIQRHLHLLGGFSAQRAGI